MDTGNPSDWTPLSYAKAVGKYGRAFEKGIYPEDVLLYYGATAYGSGPPSYAPRRLVGSARISWLCTMLNDIAAL